MTDKKEAASQKKISPDWLVRGVLAKLGETFDKFMGRDWKPSSSLATSELIERLKRLLDAEVREDGKGRFVPHNIKLKTQWDKFSTDSEEGMKRLENELLAAAIDHINDNRYHTYAPLKVQIKPDYFTEGVKLSASFDAFAADGQEEAEMNVTIPQMKVGDHIPQQSLPEANTEESFIAEFAAGEKQKTVELRFTIGRRQTVGRTKENDLAIDDISVSKAHATLMLNQQGKFLVADTGSTNGTFINGERIAYGRAFPISESDKVKFGNIEVFFRRVPKPTTFVAEEEDEKTAVFNSEEQPEAEVPSREHHQPPASSPTGAAATSAPTLAFNSAEHGSGGGGGIDKTAAPFQPGNKPSDEEDNWAMDLPAAKNDDGGGGEKIGNDRADEDEEPDQKTDHVIKLDFGENGKS